MPSSGKVRWGILGPGRMSERLLLDAGRASNLTFVAVASRDRDRAAAFGTKFAIDRVHGSYAALLADPDVDAVYIGTPNSLHHPMTMQALQAGKHVLCEKPYSRHPEQVIEAFDAAERAGLVLMEAVMWRYSPQVSRFIELLPEVGELRSIRSTFSFTLTQKDDPRIDPGLDGGSLMDVGYYCVNASRLIAGAEPAWAFGAQTLMPSGVDGVFSGMLGFGSGLVLEFVSGFTFEHRTLEAIGGRSSIEMREPWPGDCGTISIDGRDIDVPSEDLYRLELEDVSAAILGGSKPLLGRAFSLGQARAIDALYRSAASGERVALG